MSSNDDQKVNRSAQQGTSVQVKPVDNRSALQRFIQLPWSIYREDPHWVPPLLIERRQFLSPSNPCFGHARHKLWIAYRGNDPVGRISAQIDQLHLERHGDDTGFFGMLEAPDDPEIFNALMARAETWLRNRGMSRVRGPLNLSINQECGLLVDGFDTPPVLMMGHARPYYGFRVEEQGYAKAVDMLAYNINADFEMTRAMHRIMKWASRRVCIRSLQKSRLAQDLQLVRDIFEDAWSQNWGFIPFTAGEFHHLGRDLKQLVPPDFVQIAEVDGIPAAMMVVFPNINEIIRDLNGRLLPFGWLKLLWRLKIKFPQTARVPLMGVRREFQKSRLGAALALMVINACQLHALRRGIKEVELSWILEDNLGMRTILDGIGGKVYKRYRVYDKKLV